MASGTITSWKIDGETMETVRDYFLGSPVTSDGDCSHVVLEKTLESPLDWLSLANYSDSRIHCSAKMDANEDSGRW